MMNKIIFGALITISLLIETSAATNRGVPEVKALFTSQAIKIDGKLDEQVWKHAQGYEMLTLTPHASPTTPYEKTVVYLAWDKDNFYVAAKCFDSDITATGDKDEMHHYKYGDLIEVFLKPDTKSWYWELYSTPANKKTTFFFPSKGRMGMTNKVEKIGLRVASQCQGSLNAWRDKDKYWTTEIAISRKAIGINGTTLAPGEAWRILVARYNFSRYLKTIERSCYPPLSKFSFHYHKDYAKLILVKE